MLIALWKLNLLLHNSVHALLDGSLTCDISRCHVTLIVAGIAGSDYINISTEAVFTTGSIRCVDISILDDNALEGDQTFTVTLSTSDPDVMLGNDVTTITIIDNDGQAIVWG